MRNNLRLTHNRTIRWAASLNRPVAFVLVYEQDWFADSGLGFSRMGIHRQRVLDRAATQLSHDLGRHGHRLWIVKGDSDRLIPAFARQIGADQVVAPAGYAPEEVARQQGVAQCLPLQLVHDDLLFDPHEIGFEAERSPYYYTHFLNKVRPLPIPGDAVSEFPWLIPAEYPPHQTPQGLFEPNAGVQEPGGGERFAVESVRSYIGEGHLNGYATSRERFAGKWSSTRWSVALALGTIAVRQMMQEVAYFQPQTEEAQLSVQKLKEQLIWREYYRYLMMRYGAALFRRHGLRNPNRERHDDREAFDLWRNGQTGEPLVDVLMRELKSTGWMNNRGRMLAAYYLAKVMQVNWVWGALWFEAMLVDYDVYNNYGNWAYQAGTGTDSRVNRRFNLAKQVEKFDPQRHFIRQWAPPFGPNTL